MRIIKRGGRHVDTPTRTPPQPGPRTYDHIGHRPTDARHLRALVDTCGVDVVFTLTGKRKKRGSHQVSPSRSNDDNMRRPSRIGLPRPYPRRPLSVESSKPRQAGLEVSSRPPCWFSVDTWRFHTRGGRTATVAGTQQKQQQRRTMHLTRSPPLARALAARAVKMPGQPRHPTRFSHCSFTAWAPSPGATVWVGGCWLAGVSSSLASECFFMVTGETAHLIAPHRRLYTVHALELRSIFGIPLASPWHDGLHESSDAPHGTVGQ